MAKQEYKQKKSRMASTKGKRARSLSSRQGHFLQSDKIG